MKRDANPEKGLEALDQCEYMVLAMTDGEGKPYCIPLNGVRAGEKIYFCLLYTSPSPRDISGSRMPSSA